MAQGSIKDGWFIMRNQLEWKPGSSIGNNMAGGPYATEASAMTSMPQLQDAISNAEDAPLEVWERRKGKWSKSLRLSL